MADINCKDAIALINEIFRIYPRAAQDLCLNGSLAAVLDEKTRKHFGSRMMALNEANGGNGVAVVGDGNYTVRLVNSARELTCLECRHHQHLFLRADEISHMEEHRIYEIGKSSPVSVRHGVKPNLSRYLLPTSGGALAAYCPQAYGAEVWHQTTCDNHLSMGQQCGFELCAQRMKEIRASSASNNQPTKPECDHG